MTTIVCNHLAVEVEGEGPAVLCIHGLGGSSNNWTPVLGAFEAMKIIRVDLPGSARSPLAQAPLSIGLFVDALVEVLDQLAIARAYLVAHSLGTIVAQHLAVRYPQRVASLALLGPLVAPPEQGRAGIRARAALCRDKGLAGVQEVADAIVKVATSAETKAQRPVTLALVRESVMRQDPQGYAQSCEALAAAQPAQIERIAAPTLLLTGDEDPVGPPAAVHAMGERIAGSRVQVLEGCGHWTTFEKPVECIAALRDFYRTTR